MSENPSEVDNSYLKDWQIFLTGFLSGSMMKTKFFRDIADEVRYTPEFSFLTATAPNGRIIKIALSVEYADDQEEEKSE